MDPTLQSALAAAASFFLFTLIFFFCYLVSKRTHRGRNININTRSRTRPVALSSITIDESASFDPALNRISMEELRAATRNFATDLIIGDGSFGLVYKAKLSNGVTVAIKKLDPDAFQGFREFRAEMETLGKLRHQNLVQILGYCVSGSERVLIYEFIERGSLDQWLHDTSPYSSQSVKFPLSWEKRMKVVRNVANGLAYLHGLETPIIHRDIKASNVLLDFDFEAHIADFGLARQIDRSHSHVSTQVAGTMGYMPPEYREGLMVATVKADVYSFGILMFEIMTGERPNLPITFNGKEMRLTEWARLMEEHSRHMEMLDAKMSKLGLSEDRVKEYFKIAILCTKEINGDRPSMSEVVDLLQQFST